MNGPDAAANYLRDVAVGDDLAIRMKVESSGSEHKVSFSGNIGTWFFSPQETDGFYAAGDSVPERFYTPGSSSALLPPAGIDGEICAVDLFLTLFGFDKVGTSGDFQPSCPNDRI